MQMLNAACVRGARSHHAHEPLALLGNCALQLLHRFMQLPLVLHKHGGREGHSGDLPGVSVVQDSTRACVALTV